MVNIADFHVHSNYSLDAHASMEDMIAQALRLGLKKLAFTDHVDYDYPNPDYVTRTDYSKYVVHFNGLRAQYKEQIHLLLGAEIGFQPQVLTEVEQLLAQYPFDFVLCSTHCGDGLDFSNNDFFCGKEQSHAYRRYFELVYESVTTFKNYDVYGHLDFISRYGDYPTKALKYSDYADLVDAILNVIIADNKGIEFNTSGYRYGIGQGYPQLDILKRYKELGGQLITIGSDAHRPADIGAQFDQAYAQLAVAGFRYFTVYEQRQPAQIRIPQVYLS